MSNAGDQSAPSGNGGKGKQRSDAPLDRVLRALNHPIRRRMLRTLVDEKGSASTLAKKLQVNLGVASYHLNEVLAKECDLVELVESVPKRGAIEKVYRLKLQTLAEGEGVQIDNSRGASRTISLEERFIAAIATMDANAFEPPDS